MWPTDFYGDFRTIDARLHDVREPAIARRGGYSGRVRLSSRQIVTQLVDERCRYFRRAAAELHDRKTIPRLGYQRPVGSLPHQFADGCTEAHAVPRRMDLRYPQGIIFNL